VRLRLCVLGSVIIPEARQANTTQLFTHPTHNSTRGERVMEEDRENKESSAGIFEQSMEVKNRVGIGLSCRPASLNRLTESIPSNGFFGS
jgi:hypothetical protein